MWNCPIGARPTEVVAVGTLVAMRRVISIVTSG